MSRKYVIGFNGPPGAGKDASAKLAGVYLRELGYEIQHLKYADVLKRTVAYFMHTKYSAKEIEQLKDQPVEFGMTGKTLRDAYIAFSEDFAKPIYGTDIFGRLTARDIEVAPTISGKGHVYLISDAGFPAEQEPVIDTVGNNNYAMFQVHRPGKTFKGDSRSFIRPARGLFGIINNAGMLEELAGNLQANIDRVIKAGGWYA